MPSDTTHSPQSATTPAPRTATRTLFQIAAGLSVLALVFQFVTAGQILSNNQAATTLHGTGAITVHVIFGLTMLAAAAHWLLHRGAWWPTVLAAVMFAFSFAQAKLGHTGIMWAHVPGAIILTIGIVWTAASAFSRSSRH